MKTMSPAAAGMVFLCYIVVFAPIINSSLANFDYTEDEPCSESPEDASLACQRYTSCSQCENTVSNCRCDSLCRQYGDCCEDAASLSVRSARVEEEVVSCLTKVVNNVYTEVTVISKCPSHHRQDDQQTVSMCEQGSEFAPLVRGTTTGLVYSNAHCAQCHQESSSEYLAADLLCTPSNAALDDSEATIIYQLLSEGSYAGRNNVRCYFAYHAVDDRNRQTYRRCTSGVVSTCLDGHSDDLTRKCSQEPVSYVYEESRMGDSVNPPYRNRWCAECNGISRYSCKPPPGLTDGGGRIRGFHTLVDLDALSCVHRQAGKGGTVTDANQECDDGRYTCPKGKVYKPLQGCKPDGSAVADVQACRSWSNSSDYEEARGEVTLLDRNVTSSDYKIEEGRAFVCLLRAPAAVSDTEDLLRTPSVLLTTILLVLSLLCILGQLALYCVFKALRNTPGLILICMCSSLFIALLLFLISTVNAENLSNTQACVVLAIVQHYAFLAAFFWTNVMAFDVARMLSSIALSSQDKRKLIWYNLYAWGCPVIIVVSAIISEVSGGSIIPSYGANGACWFSTKYGLIVYFLAPLYLLVLANIILYIVSIASIVRAARQTKMVNPGLKERLYLAIKLIVVMGLPWIISLFSVFFNITALDYLFSVLNASQGIQIFAAYVFSKTVLNLCKKGGDFSRSRKSLSSTRTSVLSSHNRNSRQSINSKYGRQFSASENDTDEKSKLSSLTTETLVHHDSSEQPATPINYNNERPMRPRRSGEEPMRRENSGEQPMRREDSGEQPIRNDNNNEQPYGSERANNGDAGEVSKPRTLIGKTTTV